VATSRHRLQPKQPDLIYARTDIGGPTGGTRHRRWVPLLDWVGWDHWGLNGVVAWPRRRSAPLSDSSTKTAPLLPTSSDSGDVPWSRGASRLAVQAQWSQPTQSSSGTQRPVVAFHR